MIEFLHPHCGGPSALFRLPKLDSTSSVSGVHYRTALLACQIVANNAFDGYLATDRNGEARVAMGDDDLLTRERYWFIADADNPRDDYPVLPRFEDWLFPHDEFQRLQWQPPKAPGQDQVQPPFDQPAPPPRPSTDLMYTTSAKTRRCIVSNVSYMVQSSHIIPLASEPWFSRNYMEKFNQDTLGIHNPFNLADMREDLHNAWDRHMFTLVPKHSEVVVHVLQCPGDYGTREFATQWHNVPVRKAGLDEVAHEYLFAKFAQAIFALLKPFITRGFSRRVTRLDAYADADGEASVDRLGGGVLRKGYGGGAIARSSHASSRRKRSYSQATSGDSDGAQDDYSKRSAHLRVHQWVLDQDYEWGGSHVAWHGHEDEDWDAAAGTGPGRPRKRPSMSPPRRDRTSDTLPSLVTDDNASSDAYAPAGPSDPQSRRGHWREDSTCRSPLRPQKQKEAAGDGNTR